MDAQQAAALTQAIQALANTLANPQPPLVPPVAPAVPAPPAPTQVSPYEGGALDLSSRTGTSLFHSGAEELEAKFPGKVDDLHVSLNVFRDRAKMCCWIGGANDILTIQAGGQSLNLLDHYHRSWSPGDGTVALPAKFLVLTAIKITSGPLYWRWLQHHPSSTLLSFCRPTDRNYLPDIGQYAIFTAHRTKPINSTVQQIVRLFHSHQSTNLSTMGTKQMTAFSWIAREAPCHVFFDSDSVDFLLNSGGSFHMWANRHAFVSYRQLSPDEQHADTDLGLNGTYAPAGTGQINLPIEDDNGHVHHFCLDDVRHIPGIPINIIVPQMFAQQRAFEGDPSARCVIEKDSTALE